MANSQDINYALISALYANKTSGFYSDVYFPIIKYTIVQLFNNKERVGDSAYFTAQDVQDYISERFKIRIPIIVLAKSLEKIETTKKDFVDLTLMENGNSFQIRKVWDSQEFDELAEREERFSKGLKGIEADYKRFLESNGTYDDGVSYLQFISDNTQEVLGYFQNSDSSVIDEKYATIIFFLEYLHRTPSKKEEFGIAEQLFWASIIAGFLKSEKPPVDAAEEGSVKEYFLDTSILMGLLKLSSTQRELYAEELKEIIKSSGGSMRVHPMTLEEIKSILLSVESSSIPDPGSDIAEAWQNHHLSINKLAQIRFSLQSLLEKQGVKMFPMIGAEECRRITQRYKGKQVVIELARERSMKPRSYSTDNFREIHDLFMDDFIKERRKGKTIPEDVVFVTANRDLISFTKALHPEENYMISSGRVILDLWMHSVKPADISGCALTETMARCLDQHNLRVRNKIAEVSKFFNENKDSFDPQVYQDFIKKLYRRAKNVILTVETDPDAQSTLSVITAQRILDAVKADNKYSDSRVQEAESEIEKRIKEKEKLEEINKNQNIIIGNLEREKQVLIEKETAARREKDTTKQELEEESAGRKAAEEKLSLYTKRDNLVRKLEVIEAELAPYEIRRKGSFKNTGPVLLLVLCILCFLGTGLGIFFVSKAKVTNLLSIIISGILVPVGLYLLKEFVDMIKSKDERTKKAFRKWEEKPENKKYLLLNKDRDEIKNQIAEVEELIRGD